MKQSVSGTCVIDVFFRTCLTTLERQDIAARMLAIWRTLPGIRLVSLECKKGQEFEFQSISRQMAEAEARSEIYLLTDDDMEPCLNGRTQWIRDGVLTLLRHPEFGMLSALPLNATINKWTPESYSTAETKYVSEHIDVGGLRFIRKGAVTDWPKQTRNTYDREHCEAMRASGYRVGYLKHLAAVHHGEGKSTVWKHMRASG